MEKPINFLTARGDDLFDYFYSLQTHHATSYRAIAILRDEIAAAVEAKVRGECAEDIEAIRCKYDEAVADFLHAKARAERAEVASQSHYARAKHLAAELTDLRAPTPARSVMPVQLPVVNVSDFYDAPAVIIRPEQARAIVALAQEAR